jgi:hypothetical protein
MKNIYRSLCCVGLLLCVASFVSAADSTLKGQISDSMCGGSHAKMMAAHPDAKMTAHDCTNACVKAGAKYVFISKGKTYNIANQDDPDLQTHAGHSVLLTGSIDGDTITVTKIEMPAKKAS